MAKEPRLLKQHDVAGYRTIALYRGARGNRQERLVHQLVLETFVGPCPPGCEGRHVGNNDRADNRVGNLCWGTRQQNAGDKERHGTTPRGKRHWHAHKPASCPHGERGGCAKITAEMAAIIRAEPGIARVVAAKHGVSLSIVYRLRNGQTFKHLIPPQQRRPKAAYRSTVDVAV